jgi:hypothetical protein
MDSCEERITFTIGGRNHSSVTDARDNMDRRLTASVCLTGACYVRASITKKWTNSESNF